MLHPTAWSLAPWLSAWSLVQMGVCVVKLVRVCGVCGWWCVSAVCIGLAWADVLGGWGGCARVSGCGSVCVGVVMHGCVGEWVDVCGVIGGMGLVWLVRECGVV